MCAFLITPPSLPDLLQNPEPPRTVPNESAPAGAES